MSVVETSTYCATCERRTLHHKQRVNDPVELVVRSVGAEPNGILCIGVPAGSATWCIDAAWQPPRGVAGTGHVLVRMESETGLGVASTPIQVEQVVAACESVHEAHLLVGGVTLVLRHALQTACATLNYEYLQTHVDLAVATRGALEARGYLGRGSEPPV